VERFLVTGALGCLGAWTVKTLVHEGVAVVGLDAGSNDSRLRLVLSPDELEPVTLVAGDITEHGLIERVLREHEITHVIHLAALQVPVCKADPVLGASVNVVGTVSVFEAVKRCREQVSSLVYASSAARYGSADDRDSPGTHYGVYKLANEGTARIYWQDDGLASIGFRPTVVYGAGRDQGLTSAPNLAIIAAARGEPYRMPYGGELHYNYAADAARTFILAARASREGAPVHDLPGRLVGMEEVVATIEEAVPEAAGRITFEDVPLGGSGRYATDPTIDGLGAVPITPFADGVRETVEYYRLAPD